MVKPKPKRKFVGQGYQLSLSKSVKSEATPSNVILWSYPLMWCNRTYTALEKKIKNLNLSEPINLIPCLQKKKSEGEDKNTRHHRKPSAKSKMWTNDPVSRSQQGKGEKKSHRVGMF